MLDALLQYHLGNASLGAVKYRGRGMILHRQVDVEGGKVTSLCLHRG